MLYWGFAPSPNNFLSLDGKKVIKERSRLEKFSGKVPGFFFPLVGPKK
jgi:hypothetical protein